MSRNGSKFSIRRRITAITLGVLAAGALVTGSFLAFGGNDVSANYSSTTTVTGHADGGTLNLTANGTLNYSKLVPGRPQTQQVTFTNSGNVKGDDLTVGIPVATTEWTVPAGQNPDWSQLQISIPGYLAPTAITSVSPKVNVGSLDAGASKTITVVLTLKSAGNDAAGDAKDNAFQGVSVSGTATATLRTS